MRRFATIMESPTPPPINSIWVNKGKLKYFRNGKWSEFQPSIDLSDYTNAVQITYAELKSLRDAGKLVPGTQYRITDYTCTTTQSGTKSAGHVFDIIVTADDESTLNEVARAVKHEGDDYFADNDLSAWQIWYCLDNDTNKFAWADATNGKGVIYRMIDEWNNDVPYDFKNIQFYRQWDSSKSLWSTISSDNTGVPCYTFSSKGSSSITSFTDMSLLASNGIYSNVIKKYVNLSKKQTLNNNCFFGNDCYSNTFGDDCSNNTFGFWCQNNTFGDDCSNNTFENNCYSNTFGNFCGTDIYGHTLGNTLKSGCHFNSFGNNCSSNFFGSESYKNLFGDNCCHNNFHNSNNNTFGTDCSHNDFGVTCGFNVFGNNCYGNTFGGRCNNNTFGNGCRSNSFGTHCNSNTFGNNCQYIEFASDSATSTKYNYYQNNHFGDGCQYIFFKGIETSSSSAQVQNYNFAQGLQGTSGAYLTIDGVRGRSFETKVAKNSNGELKIYCEADLIL